MVVAWVLVLALVAAAEARPRALPEGNLILGYAHICQPHVLEDAIAGVNVINWFSINLGMDNATGSPQIQSGPLNLTCVAEMVQLLQELNLSTTHIITIGGWNAPHPLPIRTGVDWWAVFDDWNTNIVARPDLGFDGFDGIDWDLEGNNDPASPWNTLSTATLDIMGTMSQAAKRAGYIVTMVPPQSYFDSTTSLFSQSLLFGYPEYHPTFEYHGYNGYALVYSKYQYADDARTVPTFDLVDVQLYESWSRASYYVDYLGLAFPSYMVTLVEQMVRGWYVDFASVPAVAWPSQNVSVPLKSIVIGFSFGSPDGSGKSFFTWPESVARAWSAFPTGQTPRGTMFWNMNKDGIPANGTDTPCYLAAGFNSFLKVRPVPTDDDLHVQRTAAELRCH
eukprot:m.30885 g.30885  ORF g.30885 m.30885 type:complete len:393 (+) comp4820_c0_seq1:376-1554(+)